MSKRIFLAALLALTFGATGVARADGPTADAEQQVVDAITALRASEQAAPLVRDADLDEAALIHAEDMAAHDFVGHVSPRSGDPTARVRAVGARVRRVGENVARADSPREAIESLEASPAHRAQIVSSEFTHFGVAVVEDEEGFYLVEVFASRPAPDLPPPAVADVPAESYGSAGSSPSSVARTDEDDAEASGAAAAAATEDPSASPADARATQPSSTADAQPIAPSSEVAQNAPTEATEPTEDANAIAPSTQTYPTPSQQTPSYPQVVNGQTPNAQAYAQAPSASAGAPTVLLQTLPPPNVQGYWVQASGRWWYYPIPANARPGQALTPSTSVTGGPNTSAVPTVPRQPAYSTGHRGGLLRGLFRPSPRRF